MNITTLELVRRAMAAADMHDAAIPPATWQYWMTQENLALSIFLARSGWTLNVKTQTITVAGTEDGRFELTSTPLAIVAVHQVDSSGRVRPVIHNNAVDFRRQTVAATAATGDPTEFSAVWDQDDDSVVLHFFPAPRVGSQFLVSYIPHPRKLNLTTDADTQASDTDNDVTITCQSGGEINNGTTISATNVSPAAEPVTITGAVGAWVLTYTDDATYDDLRDALLTLEMESGDTPLVTFGSSIDPDDVIAPGVATLNFNWTLAGGTEDYMDTSVNYPLGFEERVVLGLARRALAREESDAREIIAQIRECESTIEEAVSDRVFAQHSAVRNVDSDVRGWRRSVHYPDPASWWFY